MHLDNMPQTQKVSLKNKPVNREVLQQMAWSHMSPEVNIKDSFWDHIWQDSKAKEPWYIIHNLIFNLFPVLLQKVSVNVCVFSLYSSSYFYCSEETQFIYKHNLFIYCNECVWGHKRKVSLLETNTKQSAFFSFRFTSWSNITYCMHTGTGSNEFEWASQFIFHVLFIFSGLVE